MKTIIASVALFSCVCAAQAQTLDARHLLLDGSLTEAEAQHQPFVYRTLQAAVAYLSDTTTIYVKPWVYWADDPDQPAVVVGRDGREPFGMVIHTKKLDFIGLCSNPRDIVFASQRGQTQGPVGNFTMFDFHVDDLHVENMTLGNYCNVDLDYPRNPALSRPKRSDVITQAHVGYVHGRRMTAKNVRFISRLNLNPLNGAQESDYENCHFECTDDALNGNAVYRHCDFDLYGAKPFWSTYGKGAMFVDCDFYVRSRNTEAFFTKQGGPVTVIDSRYHAPSDSIYIGWTAYPPKWLRCYQSSFTLNGKPYKIGQRQPQNTVETNGHHATIPYLDINRHEATLQTGRESVTLSCNDDHHVKWHIEKGYEQYVSLSAHEGDSIVVTPTNNTNEIGDFCIIATTDDGRETACHLTVKPAQLPPPTVINPRLSILADRAIFTYLLNTSEDQDDSRITWYRDSIPVATTNGHPSGIYRLQEADKGHLLRVEMLPKQRRSDYGEPITRQAKIKNAPRQTSLDTDFSMFYSDWQPLVTEGVWTVDGYKPQDTAEFPWSFDRKKPMWEYGQGYNGAVGTGLLQAQRGARLMYTPAKRTCDHMSLTLDVDPTKTAGQGFGSATGQYMDVCIKFDTRTLTGYGLRIIRTTKHAKAVDFYLVAYKNRQVTALTDPVSSTCYRTGCTIFVDFTDNILSAHVETTTPQPADSSLPHRVDLKANVDANPFGGIHIQHTGSCGESTTMLHRLHVDW